MRSLAASLSSWCGGSGGWTKCCRGTSWWPRNCMICLGSARWMRWCRQLWVCCRWLLAPSQRGWEDRQPSRPQWMRSQRASFAGGRLYMGWKGWVLSVCVRLINTLAKQFVALHQVARKIPPEVWEVALAGSSLSREGLPQPSGQRGTPSERVDRFTQTGDALVCTGGEPQLTPPTRPAHHE